MVEVADETTVELDVVGLDAEDVLEAGVPGTGVVDGDLGAVVLPACDCGAEVVVIGDGFVLAQLDDGAVSDGHERLPYLGVVEQRRAQVHVEGLVARRQPGGRRRSQASELEHVSESDI